MPNIYQHAALFRSRLTKREKAALAALAAAYDRVHASAADQLDGVLRLLDDALAAGEAPRVSLLYQRDHLTAVLNAISIEMKRFTGVAAREIRKLRAAAIETAAGDTIELISAALPPEAKGALIPLRPDLVEQITASTGQGSPLRDLLDQLGPDAGQRARDALVEGVSLGQHPTVIARRMRESLDGNKARALTIARTETLRAYREVQHLTMRANAHVVLGWVWWSSLDRTTCASCWAMHGSWHTLEDRLDEHPSGRCTPIPDTRPAPGRQPAALPESGPDRFAALPPEDQAAILGPGKYQALTEGRVTLPDFVERRTSPAWGSTRSSGSLPGALHRHEHGDPAAPRFDRLPPHLPPPSHAHAVRKLSGYSLNAEHTSGRHKARVFAAALGFTAADAEEVATRIIRAATSSTPTIAGTPQGWVRYRTDVEITGRAGRRATIRASWQSDAPGAPIRLTSAFVR